MCLNLPQGTITRYTPQVVQNLQRSPLVDHVLAVAPMGSQGDGNSRRLNNIRRNISVLS